MITAKLSGVQLEEVVVEAGTELDKKLLKEAPLMQFPILEIEG